MEKQIVKVSWLISDETRRPPLPSYETKGASGMDVCAALVADLQLLPGKRCLVPTGLSLAIPDGFEIQVRPRSGLAVKHGITILNAPGTIDCDYRGEVKIALVNLGSENYVIRHGDRIAQLVIAPVVQAKICLVSELDRTERGSGGFGHTGKR